MRRAAATEYVSQVRTAHPALMTATAQCLPDVATAFANMHWESSRAVHRTAV